MAAKRQVRKRKIDADRVKSRLYQVVLEGNDRDAVTAARVLLRETADAESRGPDDNLLSELRDALVREGL